MFETVPVILFLEGKFIMCNIDNVEVNYKNKKKYKTAKYPIRQPIYLTWLIWVLSFFALLLKKHKVERINMEGLKPPYMMLSNHMSFIDFELTALATHPKILTVIISAPGLWSGSVLSARESIRWIFIL